jgi:hypothetical protein
VLTSLRRQQIAELGALARWYPVRAADALRVESCLRQLYQIAAEAMNEHEPDRAIRAIAVMVPFERMKIALRMQTPRGIGGLSSDVAEQLREMLLESMPAAGKSPNGSEPESEDETR